MTSDKNILVDPVRRLKYDRGRIFNPLNSCFTALLVCLLIAADVITIWHVSNQSGSTLTRSSGNSVRSVV